MRKSRNLILALLATILASGLPATAQASPVVDQYTEELPSPGGPVPVDKNNTGRPGSGKTINGLDERSSRATGGSGVDADGTSGSDGSSTASGKSRDSDEAPTAISANRDDADEEQSLGTFATSGGSDGGGGMGWVFPASLGLIAVVVAGAAIFRRNRGTLVT